MMLLERWVVAGIVGLGLASAAVLAPGQSSSKKPSHSDKTVQPDDGAPPDQAVQPEQGAPLDQTLPPDPQPDPNLPPPEPLTEPAPPPVQATQPDPAPQAEQTPQPEQTAPPPEAAPAEATPAPAPAPVVQAPKVFTGTPQEQQLQKEANDLLVLVQELKVEVEKAGSDTLSLAALRKASQVQQLSKDLKERMKMQPEAIVSKP